MKNQTIFIKPYSQIYKGIYQSQVLTINGDLVETSMPYHEGKIVLIGVGTTVEVLDDEKKLLFISHITEKSHGNLPRLSIRLPNDIKKTDSESEKKCRVIAITSGKGGVGKTNITINMAIALAQLKQRVIIIDADLGTANVDVLMNLKAKHSLKDVINGEKEVLDVIMEGPGGVQLIPGGSGFLNLANLKKQELMQIISKIQVLEQYADYLLIDTGAGLNNNVISFILAADEVIVVTTPEPHAITDAYAIIKVMVEQSKKVKTSLIINRTDSSKEGLQVADKIQAVVKRFLSIDTSYLGSVLDDSNVRRGVKSVTPFIIKYPNTIASKNMVQVAKALLNEEAVAETSFFNKLRNIFS